MSTADTRGIHLKRRHCSLWLYYWTNSSGMGLIWKINPSSNYWCVKSPNFLKKWLGNRRSKRGWSRNPYQIFDFWTRVGKWSFTKISLITVRFSWNFIWYIWNSCFSVGLTKSLILLSQSLTMACPNMATLSAMATIFRLKSLNLQTISKSKLCSILKKI